MHVVIHAGAHITDEDRLVNCLMVNRTTLEGIGTNVPHPTSYRKLIRDLIQAAKNAGLNDEARDVVIDAIVKGTDVDRLILSNAGFFGTPKMAVSAGALYGATEERLAILHQIFQGDQIELFLAICNPATFLPAVFHKTPIDSFDEYMRGVDPRSVRWSELIARVREAYPDMPITVWCNEDLPLIWPELIRELGGLEPTTAIEGEFTMLKEIMAEPGMQRFRAYLNSHPGMSETQKRRVIAAFLDKFARDEAIEEELDIPGWTDDLIDQLTEIYDEDLYTIQSIPGINLITP